MAALNKRKIFVENRKFQGKFQQTVENFFNCINGATVCIVCNASVCVSKSCNIKGQYKPNHVSQLSEIHGQLGGD
jgi:hypothetical protein